MATLGTRNPTYRDILSGLKKDGKRDANIVELFLRENSILDDLVVMPANEGQTNLTTIRAGIPDVAWTGIYEGPQGSKGSKRQVKDACGMAESLLEVAKKLYDKAPDKEGFMLDEAAVHAEAMGQSVATALIYGNIKVNPKQFNGLAIRYPTHGGSDIDLSSYYVLNGAKDNPSAAAYRSIWLVGHGAKCVHGFTPEGSQTGLKQGAVEEVWNSGDVETNGNYKLMRQLFQWELGLTVKDFRYAGRISNIESDAMFHPTGQPDYLELVRRLCIRVRSEGVRQVFYMDRLTLEMLNVVAGRLTQSNAIRQEELFGRKITSLFGVPVRTLDCMSVNENVTASV